MPPDVALLVAAEHAATDSTATVDDGRLKMLAKQPRRRRPIVALVPKSKGQKLLLAGSETRTAIEEVLRPTATIGVAEGDGDVVGVRVDEKDTCVQTASEAAVQGALT